MKITILILTTTLVTIVVGLPPHTKENSAQNDGSYIPGVFILTDNVRKIQDQFKNEKHNKEEPATVDNEKEQGGKLQVNYHQDAKANDIPAQSRPVMNRSNQAPMPISPGTNQELLTSNRLYTNQHQNQAASYQYSNPNLHKLYLSHYPSEKDNQAIQNQGDLDQQVLYTNQQYGISQKPNPSLNQQYVLPHVQDQPSNQQYFLNQIANQPMTNQPTLNQPLVLNQVPNQRILSNQPTNNQQYILVTQPLTNEQILPNQPLTNQPIVLNHQQYLSNQNLNPSQSLILSKQQPLQVLTTQTQHLATNQMTTQGLSNQPVILVQPSQNGQPIILTQQPNQAVLIQPNQLLQNGQLEQTSNLLLASNQNGNQANLWPKPTPNQAVYSVVTLGQNSIPSANSNNYFVSVPSNR